MLRQRKQRIVRPRLTRRRHQPGPRQDRRWGRRFDDRHRIELPVDVQPQHTRIAKDGRHERQEGNVGRQQDRDEAPPGRKQLIHCQEDKGQDRRSQKEAQIHRAAEIAFFAAILEVAHRADFAHGDPALKDRTFQTAWTALAQQAVDPLAGVMRMLIQTVFHVGTACVSFSSSLHLTRFKTTGFALGRGGV